MRTSDAALAISLLVIATGCRDGTGPEEESYSEAIRADAPVLYWRFEERSGAIANDSSGFGRSGTYLSAPGLGVSVGARRTGAGVALQNETDGVSVDAGAWNDLQAFTVEAWVRPDRIATDEGMIIVDKGEVWNLFLDATGYPVFQTPGGGVETRASAPLLAGQAYHLAGTAAGGIMTLYVNGVQVSRATQATVIESRDNPLHVGRGMTAERWEFYGVIDEVALYDKALSPAAILRHSRAGD